jgi:hypothetical protein
MNVGLEDLSGEEFLGIYRYLDATPKGRDENGSYNTLADWARPRNMYGKGGLVEGSGRYHQAACGCRVHATGHPSPPASRESGTRSEPSKR